MCARKMRLSCGHATALRECCLFCSRSCEMSPPRTCRRYRFVLDFWRDLEIGAFKGKFIGTVGGTFTFNEVRRLDHIVADISEDVINVLFCLDEDLQRRVYVVGSSIRVHERVVSVTSDHRHAAVQVVSGHVAKTRRRGGRKC